MASDSMAMPGAKPQSKMTLWLGLALGLLAAIIVAMVLTSKGGDERIVPATKVAVVAAQDIPARTRVTSAMLKTQVFDVKDVDAEAFNAVSQVTNRVTSAEIKAGAIVLPTQVSDTRGAGLTFTVQPGMRAVSIGVKEVVTAGGNVVPGNQVDIIGFFKVPAGSDVNGVIGTFLNQRNYGGGPFISRDDETTATITFMQNVRVLAVAQNLQDQPQNPATQPATATKAGESAVPPEEKANPKASTVTLEVTPESAQILALADEFADLRLVLRPFGEGQPAEVFPIVMVIK